MKSSHPTGLHRFTYSRSLTVGLAAFVLFVGWFTVAEFASRKSILQKTELVQRRYDESLHAQQELENVLSLIDHPEYLELEAKQKLNVKKTGERVFVVGKQQPEVQNNVDTPAPEDRARGWFDFLGL